MYFWIFKSDVICKPSGKLETAYYNLIEARNSDSAFGSCQSQLDKSTTDVMLLFFFSYFSTIFKSVDFSN